MSLRAIQPRSFVPKTTQNDRSRARSPNLLLGKEPLCSQIREVLVGDITYWPAASGWLYLAVWMDLFSRRILGWQLDDHLQAELVIQAFEKAMNQAGFGPGFIVHSDGGSQYKSRDFRAVLRKHRAQQSMTRKDNQYDNAFVESLFSRIKAEVMQEYPYFSDKPEACIRIFDYIDGYYNTKRRHSSIGYVSPMEFEQSLQQHR